MDFGRPRDQQGMARIDEPIEDAHQSQNSADSGGHVAAYDCTESDGDVNRDVERYMTQHRVENPTQQDGQGCRQEREGIPFSHAIAWNRNQECRKRTCHRDSPLELEKIPARDRPRRNGCQFWCSRTARVYLFRMRGEARKLSHDGGLWLSRLLACPTGEFRTCSGREGMCKFANW